MNLPEKLFVNLFLISIIGVLILLTGCSEATEAALPVATPTPEVDIPAPVVTAREAALSFLREGANECVPSPVAKWRAIVNPPQTPAGFSVYRFMADGCTITVSYTVAAEATPAEPPLYHVALGDGDTGFCWQAVVNANGKIQKTGNAAAIDAGPGNPSAVYCQQQGYEYEIRPDEDDRQCGLCVFPDGTYCNSWAFFHGECGLENATGDG
jgi:putative hemolysin